MAVDVCGMAPLLQVYDMPTSIAFYRDVLGFVVDGDPSPNGDAVDWVLLRLNGMELMLNTAYERSMRPADRNPRRTSAHEDTSIYFGCPDVDAAYAQLRAQGVVVDPPAVTQYGFKAVHFKDPDGFLLCLHWPVSSGSEG